jgi:hypothetical protein
MAKPYRYFLYFMIGVMIYFFMDGDNHPEVMDKIHSIAPGLIIGVFVLLLVARYFISKREKKD